jgi:hypothetical protein
MTNRQYKQIQDVPQNDIPTIQPIYVTSGGGAIVVIAILVFSVVVIFVTSQHDNSGWAGIWGTAAFFTIATTIGLLAVNGGLASMWGDWQREKTIRNRDKHQFRIWQQQAHQQRISVIEQDLLQTGYEPPALSQAPSFVPAVPDADVRVKMACAKFIVDLFDDQGRPNPKMILPDTAKRPGQVQAKKPGSAPLEYMQSLGMIDVGDDGMLFFNTDRYPTHRDALNAINRNRPTRGDAALPGPSTPYHPQEVGERS